MGRFHIADTSYPHFVTGSIVKWLPVFVNSECCDILINSLAFCRRNKALLVHAYVIMPTHYHLIVSCPRLTDVLRDFSAHTAGEIIRHFRGTHNPPFINVFRFCGKDSRPPSDHKVWQDGKHPEEIHSQSFFMQKLSYMHDNPCRKGLVSDSTAWRYSSAMAYGTGEAGVLPVDWLEW